MMQGPQVPKGGLMSGGMGEFHHLPSAGGGRSLRQARLVHCTQPACGPAARAEAWGEVRVPSRVAAKVLGRPRAEPDNPSLPVPIIPDGNTRSG
jgi:hypothetical protein